MILWDVIYIIMSRDVRTRRGRTYPPMCVVYMQLGVYNNKNTRTKTRAGCRYIVWRDAARKRRRARARAGPSMRYDIFLGNYIMILSRWYYGKILLLSSHPFRATIITSHHGERFVVCFAARPSFTDTIARRLIIS